LVYYAHSRAGVDPSDWHQLEDHLRGVAERAAHFACKFNSVEWARIAGLWHDLGNFAPHFQERPRGANEPVDHSVLGAVHAIARFRDLGWYLAFPIAGHHAGLADLRGEAPPTPLSVRIAGHQSIESPPDSPKDLLEIVLPSLPDFLKPSGNRTDQMPLRRRTDFWIRFLFSALVDADWLDTEAFFGSSRTTARGGFAPLALLHTQLSSVLEEKRQSLPPDKSVATMNVARAEVLNACRAAAPLASGFFSLTAPTGSGKTLSSMEFALTHAERNGLDRVLVVLPYTSIIEQNAAVYRNALGAGAVIEHHSNLDPQARAERAGEETAYRHLLATENWDAPVIVTTTVQFFESLFSNRPSRCRKLHNIARSVIILDEVQTLPAGFLLPILDGLNELVAHYGCTVLLSTATPPALERRPGFELGIIGVRPIVADAAALSRQLKRVEYHWPNPGDPPIDWGTLAGKLAEQPRSMCVVHLRADARELAQRLAQAVPADPVFHLSALMCAAHRTAVLCDVRKALDGGGPCRLVATPLVEAGVDIDFPIVWRALGGLDSIVQAAGRCNREARSEVGHVFVFLAPSAPPPGSLRKALQVTSAMLAESNSELDLCDPAVFDSYFRRLYMTEEPDI
jgi:CRISPR-associated endonuclease/helicase Cas3